MERDTRTSTLQYNIMQTLPATPSPTQESSFNFTAGLVPDWAREGQQQYVMQGHFYTDHSAVAFAKACNLQQQKV